MNMYDEMLNKYAQFLGYEGKIKSDETYIMDEIEKLKKVLLVNDDMLKIRSAYEKNNNLGRTILVCHSNGSAHITEEDANKHKDLDIIVFNRVYDCKLPCICFMIDANNNTYKEVTIGEAITYIAETK